MPHLLSRLIRIRNRQRSLAGRVCPLVQAAAIAALSLESLSGCVNTAPKYVPGASMQSLVAQARSAERSGRFSRAESLYDEILQIDPSNASAKSRLVALRADPNPSEMIASAPVPAPKPAAVTEPAGTSVIADEQVATTSNAADQPASSAEPASQAKPVEQLQKTVIAATSEPPAGGKRLDSFDDFESFMNREPASPETKASASRAVAQTATAAPKPVDRTPARPASTPIERQIAQAPERSTKVAAPIARATTTNTPRSLAASGGRPDQQPPTREATTPLDMESFFAAMDAETNAEQRAAAKPEPTNRTQPAAESRVASRPVRTGKAFEALPAPSKAAAVATSDAKSSDPASIPVLQRPIIRIDANRFGQTITQAGATTPASLAEGQRESAVVTLATIGLLPEPAETPTSLPDETAVSVAAVWKRWQQGGATEDAVADLQTILKTAAIEGDLPTESAAADALGRMEADASAAVPLLRRVLVTAAGQSPNSTRAIRIAEAMLQIDPTERMAGNALSVILRTGSGQQRVAAAAALGHGSDLAVPLLANALGDESEPVRTAAALALSQHGAAAAPARRSLQEAATFDTPVVRQAAQTALQNL